jgi:hypothetical protein
MHSQTCKIGTSMHFRAKIKHCYGLMTAKSTYIQSPQGMTCLLGHQRIHFTSREVDGEDDNADNEADGNKELKS